MVDCVSNMVWERIPDINGDKLPDWKKYDQCMPDDVEFFLHNPREKYQSLWLRPSRNNPTHFFSTGNNASVVTPTGKKFATGDVVSFFNGVQQFAPIFEFTFDLHLPDAALLKSGLCVWSNTELSFDDVTLEYSNADLEKYSHSEANRLASFIKDRFSDKIKELKAVPRRQDIERDLEIAIYRLVKSAPYVDDVSARIGERLLQEFRLLGDDYRNQVPSTDLP